MKRNENKRSTATDGQRQRGRNRQRQRWADRQADTCTDRQADTCTDRQTHAQTDRDRQTHTHTQAYTHARSQTRTNTHTHTHIHTCALIHAHARSQTRTRTFFCCVLVYKHVGGGGLGTDLVRRVTGEHVFGVTMPLLTTSTGEKFGKSAGNAVWLDENMTSPYELYQFFVNVSDADIETYLSSLTLLPMDSVQQVCCCDIFILRVTRACE